MGQLNFAQNFNAIPPRVLEVSNNSLSFFPWNLYGSVSFVSLNIPIKSGISSGAGSVAHTLSIGLYSLTGSTLSLANSISLTDSSSRTGNNISYEGYVKGTGTSATQNITPGTWWWGFVNSVTGSITLSLTGGFTNNPGNAFPGAFIGGRMTDSTNALPSSFATSDLDITGSDAMFTPFIILGA